MPQYKEGDKVATCQLSCTPTKLNTVRKFPTPVPIFTPFPTLWIARIGSLTHPDVVSIGGESDNVSHSTGVIEEIKEDEDGVTKYTIKNDNTGKSTTYQEMNINYRFHESSRTQLLAAIELYLNMFDRAPSYVANESPSAEGLLEDALKVPIFNGKMKGKMVRWLEEVHARNEGKTVGKEEERGREKEDWELDWDDPRAWGEDES
ncbi:hypothetical protein YB2330_002596 [Saitoella coloradoensis]